MKTKLLALSTVAAVLGTGVAAAADGPLLIRVGVHNAEPKSGNGSLAGGAIDVDVDGQVGLTVNIGYHLTPHLAIDMLGALPFKHDIRTRGALNAKGEATHLPPTVSLQYHFAPGGRIDPYLAAGVNYTTFWNTRLKAEDGSGVPLDLDDSWGLAAQIGVDFAIDAPRQWVVGMDVRYIDIDTDASSDGAELGTVEIDPIAYGINLGYRF